MENKNVFSSEKNTIATNLVCGNCYGEIKDGKGFIIEDFGYEDTYCSSCYNNLKAQYVKEAINHPIGKELVEILARKETPMEMNILGHYDTYRSWTIEYNGIYAVVFDGMCDEYWRFVRLIDKPFIIHGDDDICCKCALPFDLEEINNVLMCEECIETRIII